MNTTFQWGSLFGAALFLAAFAGCLDSGNEPDKDPGPGEDASVHALARIKTVSLGGGDTSLTTFSYDAKGMKVRERFSFIVLEWDSQGRYVRWTQHNARDTVEVSRWPAPDSSIRGSLHSTLQTRERWFGLRANCRCADSMYRYSFDGKLNHVRRYAYDANGDLKLVTRQYFNPSRTDTAQRYANVALTYFVGEKGFTRLRSRTVYDAESEDTTRQIFEYAPLDSLIEAR